MLDAAEREQFEVLITTDRNLKYQQDLGARRIAIIVLSSTSWPRINQQAAAVAIGPVTAEALTEAGVPVGAIAARPDDDALVEAILSCRSA